MAQLTNPEFAEAVGALAEHHGVERLRERLARMNAFTSRRGLNTATAIADRLQLLTGNLRRQVPATFAFSSLWNEMVGGRVGEEGEQKLEKLADAVNACLDEHEHLVAGKEEEIDRALAAYRDALAAATGDTVARLDMLLKAVPAVAERLRQNAAPAAAPTG
jgi:ABC-type transporter Mla subunit MlaD